MNYRNTQIMSQLHGVYEHIAEQPASEERTELIDQFLTFADKLCGIRNEEIQTNTKLSYLYRDYSNYKTWNSVILAGKMTNEQFAEMKSCCDDGHELFIPEQLGLPLIREWDVTEDDHPWAELHEYELVNDKDVEMTVEELLEQFHKAKQNWRPQDYEPEVEEYEEE